MLGQQCAAVWTFVPCFCSSVDGLGMSVVLNMMLPTKNLHILKQQQRKPSPKANKPTLITETASSSLASHPQLYLEYGCIWMDKRVWMKWYLMTVIKTHQRKSFFFCFYGCLTRECGHLPLHLLYIKFLALKTSSMQLIGHALGFRKCSQSWKRHAERGATALYLWLGIQVGCFMWVSEPIQTLQEKNLRANCSSFCSKIFIKHWKT